ncbi:L-amino acid N-acyltransferase YncA [Stella humosa]|uniref:L-amino acid N-acyltransferase YncA n=1 Tax=Stella humosa TaxID=94 RepID=A0A3N1LKX0_9PROT|nr:GNAT family N-acetyltransferase [Stella humosa]ROP91389.1 L-amino acid N-acyltransferase YncA [Stella humosa]BBK34251.1 N-acetyltransferase [Stella humosa]
MPAIAIRTATVADVPTLMRLVRALAAYENLESAVVSSEEDLRRDGFGPHPAFEARIASLDGVDVGFTLFYPGYSTFSGRRSLFLEDLFVDEAARGHGLGRRLLADLARIADERGWTAITLHVLDWNPTRAFYEHLGFRAHGQWLLYSLSGWSFDRLAAE